jgi:diguanylate cyclase (GGDEF)-like protein/hemerythrin-like metal-binding protein/PAS domain S-box-containing protein
VKRGVSPPPASGGDLHPGLHEGEPTTQVSRSEAYLDAVPDGIFVATAEGRIQFASRHGVDLFGRASRDDVVGRSLEEFVERDDFARVADLLRDVRQGPAEVRLRGAGEAVWGEVSAERLPEPGGQVVLVVHDVSRRKRAEEALLRAKLAAEEAAERLSQALRELEQVAATDKLTGLFNRRHFEQVMAVELARCRRYGHLASVIMLDVDHFKAANDTFGHDAGDRVLVAIARTIAQNVRASDTACRWGGEEFAILSPGVSVAAAATLAERVRGAVADEAVLDVGSAFTISAGVAQLDPAESLEQGFRRADQALYRAKAGGRNRVEVSAGAGDAPEHRVVQLVWDPGYESGDAHLDGQHRQLFALGNALMDEAMSGAPAAVLGRRLSALLAHVEVHFADEEAALERVGWEGCAQHALLHRGLLQEAGRLKARLEAGELELPELVSFLVVRVVHDHMVRADTLFFPHLR